VEALADGGRLCWDHIRRHMVYLNGEKPRN
jgi:hypothetical protein